VPDDILNRSRADGSQLLVLDPCQEPGLLDQLGTHRRMEAGSLSLVHDLDICLIAATGELLRELVLDPTKRCQAAGQPPRTRRPQTNQR
jgi:hypothetical protein